MTFAGEPGGSLKVRDRTQVEPDPDAPAAESPPSAPGEPDLSVLDEGFLAYRYGTERGEDGHLGPGTWPVVDSTGAHRANVVVRGDDPYRGRSYTITDLAGQVLMALRKAVRFGYDVSLYDTAGEELGWYTPTAGGGVQFMTPAGPVGAPTRATGSGTPVRNAAGEAVARVYGHAPSRPLNALGTWPSIDPDWTWYLIDKAPRLADPLRSFVLGLPCVAHWQLGEAASTHAALVSDRGARDSEPCSEPSEGATADGAHRSAATLTASRNAAATRSGP